MARAQDTNGTKESGLPSKHEHHPPPEHSRRASFHIAERQILSREPGVETSDTVNPLFALPAQYICVE